MCILQILHWVADKLFLSKIWEKVLFLFFVVKIFECVARSKELFYKPQASRISSAERQWKQAVQPVDGREKEPYYQQKSTWW